MKATTEGIFSNQQDGLKESLKRDPQSSSLKYLFEVVGYVALF